jgi:hypothetical protein
MLKRIGDRLQPCLRPFVDVMGSESDFPIFTYAVFSNSVSSGLIPLSDSIHHSLFLGIELYTFPRSTKTK